jgi:carbamoylphosphate synthase small subunit
MGHNDWQALLIGERLPAAMLALADGTTFTGYSFGALVTATGEVVFNTSMTGYQEIITDPSYHGPHDSLNFFTDFLQLMDNASDESS